MVDALVAVAREAGGLPLLQFALAELWEARDTTARVIPTAALERMGGRGRRARPPRRRGAGGDAAGAARRRAAQPALAGDRARARARAGRGDDLVRGDAVARAGARGAGARPPRRRARGDRDTLRDRARGAGGAAGTRCAAGSARMPSGAPAAQRLERAAGEWERLGRAREALWSGKQLAEARTAGEPDAGTREAAFVAASRRALRRAARCSGRRPRRRR